MEKIMNYVNKRETCLVFFRFINLSYNILEVLS